MANDESEGGEIEISEKGEITLTQLEVSNIVAVDEAIDGCEDFLNREYISKYLKELAIDAKAHETEVTRGIVRRTREVILPYDYVHGLSWENGNKIREKCKSPIVQKLGRRKATIFDVMDKLDSVGNELGIFLRYFFPTPVNRSAGKREWREIVPVEESFVFGLYTHFVPFEKSGQEKFASMSENLQAIGSVLDPSIGNSFVRRVIATNNDFNQTLSEAAQELTPLSKRKLKPDEHLSLDVRVLNYALSQMVRTSYSPMTGLCGIMATTALRRIGKNLEKRIERLGETVNYSLRNISESNYALSKIGYRIEGRPTLRERLGGRWDDYTKVAVKEK